jgi:hypothetical protein
MKFQENNDIGCMYKQWFKNQVKHKQRAHYISVDLRIKLMKYVDIVNVELIESTQKTNNNV